MKHRPCSILVSESRNTSKWRDNKETKQRCYNCNKPGHFARDSVCPAKSKNCNECGAKGHFSACCRAKRSGKVGKKKGRAYQVTDDVGKAENNEYAFVVKEFKSKKTGEVDLTVGGVELKGVLIDSGSTCNLIDYETWNYLKEQRIDCESVKCDKKFLRTDTKSRLM